MTRPLRFDLLASGPVDRQATGRLVVDTTGPGFTDITGPLAGFVREAAIAHGAAALLCRHTSASLTVTENADPDVRTDLEAALARLAPRGGSYLHGCEGPDDMPAHIRAVLTDACLVLPILNGSLALGTWQAVYLVEHRDRPHRREIVVNVTGT